MNPILKFLNTKGIPNALKKIVTGFFLQWLRQILLFGKVMWMECNSPFRTILFGLNSLLTGQGLLSPPTFLPSLVVGKFQTRHCPLRRWGGPTRKR